MRQTGLRHRLLLAACVVSACLGLSFSAHSASELETQRTLYRSTLHALDRGDSTAFKRYRELLRSYPLYPYLELTELRRRLPALPRQDVDDFLARYGQDLPALRLRNAWLQVLESRGRWSDYLTYYVDEPMDTERRCKHAWALLQLKQSQAAASETAAIWLNPRSLPKSCDTLFQSWYRLGNPAPELAWQRFHLAMNAGETRFAGYLSRYLDKSQAADATFYAELRVNPGLAKNTARFDPAQPRHAQLAEFALGRLAARDPASAAAIFATLRAKGVLNDESARATAPRIASALASRSGQDALQWIIGLDAAARSESLGEDGVRYALRGGNWSDTLAALQLLPETLKQSERWLYWRTRSDENIDADAAKAQVPQIYRKLSARRSYYGFLSADRIKVHYEMEHQPVEPDEALQHATENLPGIRRARERFLLNEPVEWRREWLHAVQIMSNRERETAARLATNWGWHQLAISTLITAEQWNALELRFPMLYAQQFGRAAQRQRIDRNWLYAIARQESSFNAGIKSPAGALGLMQVMPRTAQATARNLGIRYRGAADLLNPDTNVNIGSRYMRLMLDDFQQNRVLAAAAYNAGPGRVKQWLRRLPDTVDHDVFVETIPFRETRQYVQNVLAFAVIYAYLQGNSAPLVLPDEALIRTAAGAKSG